MNTTKKIFRVFLASGKSYSQIERDRLFMFYEPMHDATKRTAIKSKKIEQGKKETENAHYVFDSDAFL